jgi:hypothetical protein
VVAEIEAHGSEMDKVCSLHLESVKLPQIKTFYRFKAHGSEMDKVCTLNAQL